MELRDPVAEDDRLFEVFLDVQRGLPRQGPGCDESTRQALSLCAALPDRPAVLDVGCGPGAQTLVLAEALSGSVTAVDKHGEYLDQLAERAMARGLSGRITLLVGDMTDLPFPDGAFDLIWSEGAAYIMGFQNALSTWRRLLRPGGCLAVSELVWTRSDAPAEVAAFFAEEYPAMTTAQALETTIRSCGYEPLGHFTLPDAAWWDDYYSPLQAKLPVLRRKYAGDEAALSVVAATAREIEMRRRFADWYGYEFFVSRRPA